MLTCGAARDQLVDQLLTGALAVHPSLGSRAQALDAHLRVG
jgi:hypothetical protein